MLIQEPLQDHALWDGFMRAFELAYPVIALDIPGLTRHEAAS